MNKHLILIGLMTFIMLIVTTEWLLGNTPPAFQFRFNGFVNAEILYDVAAYGTPDTYFAFDDMSPADNVRVLLTVKYAF